MLSVAAFSTAVMVPHTTASVVQPPCDGRNYCKAVLYLGYVITKWVGK